MLITPFSLVIPGRNIKASAVFFPFKTGESVKFTEYPIVFCTNLDADTVISFKPTAFGYSVIFMGLLSTCLVWKAFSYDIQDTLTITILFLSGILTLN